ncbi:MAG: hypothetical protein P4N41_18980 [Negativicutes bacterium]|nr:hypothetical protein [Negativicutes bacterium]
MKKIVTAILVVLVLTAFGASVALADGGQYIVDRMDQQRADRQADVVGAPDNAATCYSQNAKGTADHSMSMSDSAKHIQCH